MIYPKEDRKGGAEKQTNAKMRNLKPVMEKITLNVSFLISSIHIFYRLHRTLCISTYTILMSINMVSVTVLLFLQSWCFFFPYCIDSILQYSVEYKW